MIAPVSHRPAPEEFNSPPEIVHGVVVLWLHEPGSPGNTELAAKFPKTPAEKRTSSSASTDPPSSPTTRRPNVTAKPTASEDPRIVRVEAEEVSVQAGPPDS